MAFSASILIKCQASCLNSSMWPSCFSGTIFVHYNKSYLFDLHIYTQVHAHTVNTQPNVSLRCKNIKKFPQHKVKRIMEISELIGKWCKTQVFGKETNRLPKSEWVKALGFTHSKWKESCHAKLNQPTNQPTWGVMISHHALRNPSRMSHTIECHKI